MTPATNPAPHLAAAAALLAMGLLGGLSVWWSAPLLFPAVGASAFLACAVPGSPLSAPRNALIGHAIGLASGCLPSWALDVQRLAPWLVHGDPWRPITAASLGLGAATYAMVRLRAAHPPAGATTLIFATGAMGGWRDALAVLAAVAVLVTTVGVWQRSKGVGYPRWQT